MRLKFFLGFILIGLTCQSQASTQQLSTQEKAVKSAQNLPSKTKSPQNQQDLWKRISMQFKIAVPKNNIIQHYINWYVQHPEHLNTVSQRAKPYLYEITTQIENRNLPLELALLPAVESTFDPFAKSWGGAAGLWQFMPATASSLGLQHNRWYDGRRDVNASTKAALTYLTQLNQQFHGNWPHAIAAYNSGGGRISSAIRANRNAGKSTDYFSLNLPRETTVYVPKLLALSEIMQHPEKYGVRLPAIPNRPARERVELNKQISLNTAARYANVSLSTIKQYNPGYLGNYTSATGPRHIYVPVGKASLFAKKLELHSIDSLVAKNAKASSYIVQPGDSLSVIAQKHQVNIASLESWNNINRNANLKIGQKLVIYEPSA